MIRGANLEDASSSTISHAIIFQRFQSKWKKVRRIQRLRGCDKQYSIEYVGKRIAEENE